MRGNKVSAVRADSPFTSRRLSLLTDSSEGNDSSTWHSGSKMDRDIRNMLGSEKKTWFAKLCQGNPLSRRGQRVQMAKMMILLVIPIVCLCGITTADLTQVSKQNDAQALIRNTIRFSAETGELIHYLQRERDMTALHLSSMGAETRMFLKDRYPDTDKAMDDMSQWPRDLEKDIPHMKNKELFREHVQRHRDHLDIATTDPYEEIRFYSGLVANFIDWIYNAIQDSRDADQWRSLVAYQLLILAKEDLGVERTLGGVFYSKGRFDSHEDYLWYLEKHNVGVSNIRAAKRFSDELEKFITVEELKYANNTALFIAEMRDEISRNNMTGREPSWQQSTYWFDNMTVLVDMMFLVQKRLSEHIYQEMTSSLAGDVGQVGVSIGLFMIVVFFSPLIVVSVRYIISDVQRYALTLALQTRELGRERTRNEGLLYQMLPPPVAEQLKNKRHVIAEAFDEASVFFSDIVGFTKISSECTPMQVINMLNNLYVCFDSRIDLYEVYKVETIGDAYMVVSGIPQRIGRRQVYEIANMALDLQHHIAHVTIPHLGSTRMTLRVGIHSGPCVAGVVGSTMPRYCLFGDTVTHASTMESHGSPGKIHISCSTHDLLLSDPDYIMEKRLEGDLPEGIRDTYFLLEKLGFEMTLPCMPGCKELEKPASVTNLVVIADSILTK